MHVSRAPLVALVAMLLMSGCVTSGPHDWGSDATWHPGKEAIRAALVDAVKDPHVWVPLAGAAVFQINGWDRKVSNWARDNTPVFGSQHNASQWSDSLRTCSSVSYFATVLATPDPNDAGDWVRDKAQGLGVGLGAIAVAGFATTTLKDITHRTRPNGVGHNSFPSGHTSHSAVLTGLARDNLEDIDMSPYTRHALDAGLDALTIGTAWARIEAGAHFPSDTLVSYALGSFVSRVADRAFLSSGRDSRLTLSVEPLPHGLGLQWEWRY